MRNSLHLKKPLFIFFLFCFNFQSFTQKLSITTYTPGLTSPIAIKHGGDDRLFVAERGGRIRIINPDGTLRAIPFLDITSKLSPLSGEEGLLGLALSPDFLTTGKFYVNYTTVTGGNTYSIIEEYKTSAGDQNIADPTALPLLSQLQPTGLTNHKGGNLMFGKDGYLYISLGDGGGGGDPFENGQNTTTFLGKILRIDVSNSSTAQPYTIPPSNPFANDPSATVKKEIWSYGMRNPWRCSVDRITGDVWIADVGQGNWEEIDYEQYEGSRNANYGWNILEGSHCYPPGSSCDPTGIKLPVYEYDHSVGQSITGGYVYRSAQSKSLFGTYLYTDYGGKWIDGLRQNNGVATLPVQRLLTGAQVGGSPICMGEDRYGDLYILFNGDNAVYKISDTSFNRRPKAYLTPVEQGSNYLLQALKGPNLSYQWLKDGVPVAGATNPDFTPNVPGTYTLVVTNNLNITDTSAAFVFGALPVTLNNFNVQRGVASTVNVKWHTLQENDILNFTILRRLNNQTAFSVIGSIPAKGNRSSVNGFDYLFTDSTAAPGAKLFYRLKIQNKDGSFSYSDIKIINGNSINSGFVIYPNPAKGQVTININDYVKPVQLVIYDHIGRQVKKQTLNQSLNTVSLTGLIGIYTITIIEGNKNVARERLLVQ